MTSSPWYREPWPWIVMAGPAAVVVAGIVTMTIAFRSFDGVVADDYYKQGLAINRVLAREAAARQLGATAVVAFSIDRAQVRVTFGGRVHPASLRLALIHPTLRGSDQSIVLAQVSPDRYEGTLAPARPGKYLIRVEDGEGRWRLSGAWSPNDDAVRLAP